VPAKQPKEGIGFELHVAAALKTEAHSFEGKSLDLTDFYFNISPKTYSSTVTNAGYDVTVDITASKDDVEYLIECKSSRYRDEVLKINNDQFLKSMLEFLALELFSEQTKWNFKYILATNFPIARDVGALGQSSPQQLEGFRNVLVQFGRKEYGENFNPDVAKSKYLTVVLKALTFLELPDQYLKSKMNSDEDYKRNYEMFSSRLKQLRTQLSSEGGLTEITRFARVSFLCKSSDHEECRDIVTDGIVCHIGKTTLFISRLEEFQKENKSGIKLVRANQLGFSVNDVTYPTHLSSKEASEAITAALNTFIENNYSVYIVPGTFDVILIDTNRMVHKVKNCFNSETLKYQLDTVKELEGLGPFLKVSVARSILNRYHLSPDESDFVSEEELDKHEG